MFDVSVESLRGANGWQRSEGGLVVVPTKDCSRPVCPEDGRECDIFWLKEERCERDGSVAMVSCRVLAQTCDAQRRCKAQLRHCTNACDRGGSCGGDGDAGLVGITFTWPAPSSYSVLRSFGIPDEESSCGFHTGIDIGGEVGTSVVALADGRVVHVGPLWVEGEGVGRGDAAIVIRHAPGLYSVYSHNSRALIGPGLCVEAGQEIARMGSDGFSHGIPHVHVELLEDPLGKLKFASWPVPFYNACRFYKDLSLVVAP